MSKAPSAAHSTEALNFARSNLAKAIREAEAADQQLKSAQAIVEKARSMATDAAAELEASRQNIVEAREREVEQLIAATAGANSTAANHPLKAARQRESDAEDALQIANQVLLKMSENIPGLEDAKRNADDRVLVAVNGVLVEPALALFSDVVRLKTELKAKCHILQFLLDPEIMSEKNLLDQIEASGKYGRPRSERMAVLAPVAGASDFLERPVSLRVRLSDVAEVIAPWQTAYESLKRDAASSIPVFRFPGVAVSSEERP